MNFLARQIQEKCREQNQEVFMAFIDLTKAFDSINREALWKVLSRCGCPVNLTKILRLLHDKMTASVLFNGTDTDPFTIQTWVKQGCCIAPTLFIDIYIYAPSFFSFVTDVPMTLNMTEGLMRSYVTTVKANTKVIKTSSSLPTLQKNFRLV